MGTSIDHGLGPTDDASFVGGQSEAVQRLNAIVGQIARTEIAVLLVGESGSGKETYAHLIHRLSEQRDAPLQKLSCAAWEPGQLLSRLKAHLQTQPGDGVGVVKTLYLDGIDELDLASQKVLLSLLRDGDGSGVDKSRLRLISSASQELRAEVESGRFRRDLYFRINGVCLRLPPLRERKEDIPALIEHFLAKHSMELRRHTPVLGSQEVELLIAHDWPGNIRELANLVQKMVALGNPAMAVAGFAAGRTGAHFKGARANTLESETRGARAEDQLQIFALQDQADRC